MSEVFNSNVFNKIEETQIETNKEPHNSFYHLLPELIKEAISKNIEIGLSKNGYTVYGFYGQGKIELIPLQNGDGFIYVENKKNKRIIKTFKDLVALNVYIWSVWRNKFAKKDHNPYIQMDKQWQSHILHFGFVEYMPKIII